jgi:hypothetical protein
MIDHAATLEAAKRIVGRRPAEAFVDAIFQVCPLTPEEYAKVLPENRWEFDGSMVANLARAYIEREQQIKDAISAIYRDAQLTIDSIYEAGMLGALRILREKLGVPE